MHGPPKELHIVVFFPLTVTKEIEPVEEECHFTTLTLFVIHIATYYNVKTQQSGPLRNAFPFVWFCFQGMLISLLIAGPCFSFRCQAIV